jgi:2-oxoglutarate dehydrogenase E2 component (dihydrolipoamide succinyltransferase)
MIIEIKVPSPGESITEVQLASWLVSDGDHVEKDQEIAEIDSDKATLTISAEEEGLIKTTVSEGDTIDVGSVIATIDTAKKGKTSKKAKTEEKKQENKEVPKEEPREEKSPEPITEKEPGSDLHISPLAKKLMAEKDISPADLQEFFRNIRVSKKDVEFYLSEAGKRQEQFQAVSWGGTRDTRREKMSTLRNKLAQRLVAVKNETAMLTTFNEVNMTPIFDIRKKYKEEFKEKYGVSLGFMSFFTKAITVALHHFPQVNAMIDGTEIIYHDYADIGIAVSTPKGLMVPVLRNAETMSFADIELKIKELAVKARDNKITLDEMKGGTFTITNGGVFGSMLSTPIINPPQSAILGMHNIVERPLAVNGQVEIHPVMYVALSYDHRIVDGRESVSFLVMVKEMLENPEKMMFDGLDPHKSLLGLT